MVNNLVEFTSYLITLLPPLLRTTLSSVAPSTGVSQYSHAGFSSWCSDISICMVMDWVAMEGLKGSSGYPECSEPHAARVVFTGSSLHDTVGQSDEHDHRWEFGKALFLHARLIVGLDTVEPFFFCVVTNLQHWRLFFLLFFFKLFLPVFNTEGFLLYIKKINQSSTLKAFGYLGVSIIHQTLTWTTGALMCVSALFACVCTKSQPKDYVIESAQNLTGEIPVGAQSIAHTGHPSFWWPHLLILSFGFQEQALKQSCSAPPTLPVTGSDFFNNFMESDEPVLLGNISSDCVLDFQKDLIFFFFFLNHNWVSEWNRCMHIWSW